jgi:predicted permease
MISDLRLACRALSRHRGLAVAAVLTLALGIGSTTAIFSAADAVLLHPLPFRDQARLVVMWQTDLRRDAKLIELSHRDFADWRDQATRFEGMAAMTAANIRVTLKAGRDPVPIEAAIVSNDFFRVLGASPRLGRDFRSDDDRADAPTAVVIAESLWRREFAADESVAGRSVVLDGSPATVVGVMPPEMLPRGAEVWFSAAGLARDAPDLGVLQVVGRLKPDVTIEAARAELEVIAARLARARPKLNEGLGATIMPLTDQVYGATRPALYLLSAAVALLLLIACANVANLLLARAVDRQREIAVRMALGAGTRRIARETFAESSVLAVLGGIGGLALAAWSVDALRAMVPVDVPGIARIAVDFRVAVFAVMVSAFTALVFGLAPALRAAGVDPGHTLKDTRSSDGAGVGRLRGALVVTQLAISLALVAAAALTGRSFVRLAQLEPGFDSRNVFTARIQLGDRYADVKTRAAFFEPLLSRLNALPGVESAGLVLLRPLSGPIGWEWPFTLEGQDARDHAANPLGNFEAVSAGYFATMRIPLVEGRNFTDADLSDAPHVAIVSEALARRYWPGQRAVGRRIKAGAPDSQSPWKTIVGVVGNARYRDWRAVRLDVYVPYQQWSFRAMDVILRTTVEPRSIAGAVRQTVFSLDRDVPLATVTTMEEAVADAMAGPRFVAVLLGLFSAIALMLAAVGTYGVIAWSIRRRTREIGIRIALGAARHNLLWTLMRQAFLMVAIGLASGAALALASGRLLSGLLFEVSATDATSLLATTLALAVTGIGAAGLAVARAVSVSPFDALRHE